ncbi:MAG: UDP-glucose/GDP-mannose dehydrogenase family protein [Rhodobacteraceae bacterium]|nr:UDP-glucose/GDP-mannose dehydrogenase family protein [Paracoccaceae bacterium]
MKITVFGTGYVGLVQGAVLAEVGHEVLCVDVDEAKVAGLKAGRIPIYEPGLEDLVKKTHAEGRLNFTTDAAAGVAHGRVQVIAVGTPPDEDGSADLSYVLAVAGAIAEHMTAPKVVVTKSTVPVGTADRVRARLKEGLAARGDNLGSDLGFDVVSNPEFLKEGAAVADCMRPDRIVIGTDSEEAEEVLREVYAPFNRNHDKIILMDVRSAELTKYAANAMLATKISFMNEIAGLAERLGADVEAVRMGIGSDPRIGYHFIYPGAGYGGSCFPKDVKALIATAREIGFEPKVLQAVEDRNDAQKTAIFAKIARHYDGALAGRVFALWGLAFKPNTDDMREAASRVLVEALWAAGARVQAYDPEAMEETQRLYGDRPDLTLCGTKEAALRGADALVVMTEWQAFRAPDFELIQGKLKAPVVFDGRNLYDPARMAKKGFAYYAIGRGLSEPPVQVEAGAAATAAVSADASADAPAAAPAAASAASSAA